MSQGFVWDLLEHILTIIDTLSEFSFLGFSIGPYGAMQKFRTPCTGGFQKYFFFNCYFNLLFSNPFHVLKVGEKLSQIFQFITPPYFWGLRAHWPLRNYCEPERVILTAFTRVRGSAGLRGLISLSPFSITYFFQLRKAKEMYETRREKMRQRVEKESEREWSRYH